ncbi:MAG: TspO/MBR family protein [Bacteroidota bacterium]
MIFRIIIFLILNFTALAIGGSFTGEGFPSEWYVNMNKAPWTPPGWVFGAAWTTIMICYAFFMSYLWPVEKNRKFLIGLYAVQWVLNLSWNPVFFYFHQILAGLIIICSLTIVVGFFLFRYRRSLKLKSALILPYFIWLLIATSLNGYIFLNN